MSMYGNRALKRLERRGMKPDRELTFRTAYGEPYRRTARQVCAAYVFDVANRGRMTTDQAEDLVADIASSQRFETAYEALEHMVANLTK